MITTDQIAEFMQEVKDILRETYGDDYEDYVDVKETLTFHSSYRALCEGVSPAHFVNMHF